MTIAEIQKQVKKRAKPLSRGGLYKHIRALGLKPLGVARPAIYSDDAAEKIIVRLGDPKSRSNKHTSKHHNGKGRR